MSALPEIRCRSVRRGGSITGTGELPAVAGETGAAADGAVGVDWFAARLDQILGLARASVVDAGLADDLIAARDLALMIEDWAKHRAGCGDYFFTVTIQMRTDDKHSRHTFTVPHDDDAAEFLGKLTSQIALMAGRRAQDGEIVRALTELAAIATGLAKALIESLGDSAGPR